jgi:ferritin-like metal-binding protein YciE/uncharacterized protein YjbJ (UPF0337 family)
MPAETVLTEQLEDALSLELALVQTLTAHIGLTPRGAHRDVLERHLEETSRQAEALRKRLQELGVTRNPIQLARGAVVSLVGQVVSVGKAPVDLLRGPSGEEKVLKNARDEAASEALEIATYDALEAMAVEAGDRETAELARRHRREEERALDELRELIPQLAREAYGARARGESHYDLATTGVVDAVRRTARFVRGQAGEATERAEELADEARDRAEELADEARDRAEELADEARDRIEEAADDVRDAVLPIEGYDDLSASELLPRLEDLDDEALARVDAYERLNRDRKSVTDRIKRLRERSATA